MNIWTNHTIGLGHALIQHHHTILPSLAPLQDLLLALSLTNLLVIISMPKAWVHGATSCKVFFKCYYTSDKSYCLIMFLLCFTMMLTDSVWYAIGTTLAAQSFSDTDAYMLCPYGLCYAGISLSSIKLSWEADKKSNGNEQYIHPNNRTVPIDVNPSMHIYM